MRVTVYLDRKTTVSTFHLYRSYEEDHNENPIISGLYLPTTVFGSNAPDRLTVTLEDESLAPFRAVD